MDCIITLKIYEKQIQWFLKLSSGYMVRIAIDYNKYYSLSVQKK